MPWREQLKTYREVYRERRDALLDGADRPDARGHHLDPARPAACSSGRPCPTGLDSKAMMPRAIAARVAYVPGTGFYADGTGSGNMRLNFSFPPPERIREGVRRLAGVMEQELAMRQVFGAISARADAPPWAGRVRRPRPRLGMISTHWSHATDLRVLVLAGGLSYERDVSLRSGRRVLDALRAVGHRGRAARRRRGPAAGAARRPAGRGGDRAARRDRRGRLAARACSTCATCRTSAATRWRPGSPGTSRRPRRCCARPASRPPTGWRCRTTGSPSSARSPCWTGSRRGWVCR